MNKAKTRAGFVALIGAPNAGKSTLLNTLVGEKIAIVTHKAQTTRSRISGMVVRNNAQLIFVDTPGIFEKPKRRLERAMVDAAWKAVHDADLAVLVVDAKTGVTQAVQHILEGLEQRKIKATLVLNKVDVVKRENLLALTDQLNRAGLFTEIFMISALKGDGVDDLFYHLAQAVPESPFLFPEDQMTDISQRFLANEITREKLFMNLHEELPYSITVETRDWQKKKDGSIRIEQDIHCARDNHKAMIIGKKGAMLKKVGTMAREDMEDFFATRIHLFLFVKVSPEWFEKSSHFREIGLDYVE